MGSTDEPINPLPVGYESTPVVELEGGEALVASGATLMRVEHDAMLAVSVQRPRNKGKVLAEVLSDLEIVPSLASRCYYTIPYKDRGTTVHVTGPSIHAARNLARAWGNCAAKAVVIGEDSEKVTLAGVFVDLETNVRFERPQTVSRYLKRRDGRREHLADHKLIQAIQAGASKAERNAILAGLPDWLVQSYDTKARKLAADATRQQLSKLLEAFLEFGVRRDVLESHIGCALENATDEQLADLRGIYAALRDKQATPEEIFEGPAEPEPETDDVETVLKCGAETTGGAEKPKEDKAKASNKRPADPRSLP